MDRGEARHLPRRLGRTLNKYQRYERTDKGRARKRRYRQRKLALGICIHCTQPAVRGRTKCEAHAAAKREWAFLNPG